MRAHIGRRAVEGEQVVLEDLDALETGGGDGLELLVERRRSGRPWRSTVCMACAPSSRQATAASAASRAASAACEHRVHARDVRRAAPVNRRNASAAWCTHMPPPVSVRAPFARAALISCGLERRVDDVGDPVRAPRSASARHRVAGNAQHADRRRIDHARPPAPSAGAAIGREAAARGAEVQRSGRHTSAAARAASLSWTCTRRGAEVHQREGDRAPGAARADEHDRLALDALRARAFPRSCGESRCGRCCSRWCGRSSAIVTVLTAPICCASAEISSSSGMTASLQGKVTLMPSKPGRCARAEQVARAGVPGRRSRSIRW